MTTTARTQTSTSTDRVIAAHDTLIDLVEGLQSSSDWKAALDTAARFHRYSFGNSLLIAASHARAFAEGRVPDPHPDLVAGYRTWQGLGRQVQRGQQGHTILCPRTRIVRDTDTPKGDDRTQNHTEPPDGADVVSAQRRVTGWTTATVFSLSQTDGEPLLLPPRPALLQGAAPPGLWDGLVAQLRDLGFDVVTVQTSEDIGGANGVTNFTTHLVRVRTDMDDAAQVKTLAHELGHVLLHDPARTGTDPRDIHRGVLEVEAESVAYLIGAAHGMDTTGYTLPYVATWAGGTDPAATVRATAERVVRTARTVLDALPTDHGLGGQPPAVGRNVRPAERRTRAIPALTPPAAGVSR
ncbi:MAG: serine/arginine repetitive matrix protein 2 [Actinobacteria bacterium]|nr:serine/arginine repetitive matrix protein 2 [Actinomycetota bacterium]